MNILNIKLSEKNNIFYSQKIEVDYNLNNLDSFFGCFNRIYKTLEQEGFDMDFFFLKEIEKQEKYIEFYNIHNDEISLIVEIQ